MNAALLDRVQAPFAKWQQGLVFEKKRYVRRQDQGAFAKEQIRERQEQLEAAVRDGPLRTACYLRRALEIGKDQDIGAVGFPRAVLTPGEYQDPPLRLEQELGTFWENQVSPREGSRPCFWLLCHIEWIERGILGSADLAPYVLAGSGQLSPEQKTRNFLRRTGGIYIRGKTSVFSDCTLARAFWRNRMAQEIHHTTRRDVSASDAHRVLHWSRPAWERLVLVSLRRLTVMNHPRARAAIVRGLGERLQQAGRINHQQVNAMAMELARIGLRYSFGHLPSDILSEAVERFDPDSSTRIPTRLTMPGESE